MPWPRCVCRCPPGRRTGRRGSAGPGAAPRRRGRRGRADGGWCRGASPANGTVGLIAGVLITIEGLDGAGKSTLAGALAAELPLTLLREPGGVALSERIRALVSDPELRCDARAEALLYAAARAQLVTERLDPLLRDGTSVLLDRFVDSSLAYQGTGRGLGIDEVAALNRFATGGLTPDRTLLLRCDPALGRARLSDRGLTPDRLELEAGDFFAAVQDGYDQIAEREPQRFRVLDASRPPVEVLAAARSAMADLELRTT